MHGRKWTAGTAAPVESFFPTPKTELSRHRDYKTRWEARTGIFERIEAFCNRHRRHSALGCFTPEECETIKLAA